MPVSDGHRPKPISRYHGRCSGGGALDTIGSFPTTVADAMTHDQPAEGRAHRMALTHCLGCHALTRGGSYCTRCRTGRKARRGSTTARGLGLGAPAASRDDQERDGLSHLRPAGKLARPRRPAHRRPRRASSRRRTELRAPAGAPIVQRPPRCSPRLGLLPARMPAPQVRTGSTLGDGTPGVPPQRSRGAPQMIKQGFHA